MNISGNKVLVNKSQKETFHFLTDLKNFEQLMPASIQKFEVDEDSFIFGLKGMP
jgi:carbon monoxide dehydrogenase subunit G